MTNNKHLTHKPVIVNNSSYENIPLELRELGDDIIDIANSVYDDVLSINWHGSIPRGDFVFGESDADITIFIDGDFKDGHWEKRQQMLKKILPKWQKKGIFKLDVMAVPKSEFHENSRQLALFFCESDGIFLPGFPKIDFSFTVPKTNFDLVKDLNQWFKLWLEDYNGERLKVLTQDQIYKQIWKRTYRAIYGLAILDGAPYQQSWRLYPELIATHTPKHSNLLAKLTRKNLGFEELLKIGDSVLQQLESQGAVFKSSWNS